MNISNMVRMGTQALRYNLFGSRFPSNVMLAVTNRCNGRCNYCQIPERPGPEMSLEDILSLIDQMKAAGTTRLGLWGGEPLVRDDIGDIVSRAKQHGMFVTMDSNGLLWQKRKDDLQDLDHVMFALDGPREAHEANRGEGTFERVMDAVETAAATPGLKVWTLSVLTKHNVDKIDFIIDNAERLGIFCAFQFLHHNDVLGRNHDTMLATNQQYRDVVAHLRERKRAGAPISSSYRYLNYLDKWDDYSQHTQEDPHLGVRCKAGGMYCNIDADGKVYGCSLNVGKVSAKNALEVGFKEAFDAIPPVPCQACTAACFTEYNYIFGLDPLCICEWVRTTTKDR